MADEKEILESKNMKKFFKTPEELSNAGYDEYKQMLNAYMKKEKEKLDETEFILVADFEFKEPKTGKVEIGPILFLGTPNTQWKQAIKADYKKRNSFAQGVLDLIELNGDKYELLLVAESGKGAKDKNLKELKKLPAIKNLFEDLRFADVAEEEEEKDDLKKNAEKEIEEAHSKEQESETNATESELAKILNKSTQLIGLEEHLLALKAIQSEDADDKLDELYFMKLLVIEWNSLYKKGDVFNAEKAAIEKMNTFIHNTEARLLNLDAKQELIDIYRMLKQLRARVEKRTDLPTAVRLKYYEEYITISTDFKNWYHLHRSVVEKDTELEKLYKQFRVDRDELKKILLKGIDNPEKEKLFELKAYTMAVGYNPKDIQKINELTDLSDFPSRSFTDRGLHLILDNLREKYLKLPMGDVEGRRLLLWEMLTNVNNHLNENNGEIDSKKAPELKAFAEKLYAKISAIADFEASSDNYLKLLATYEQFNEKLEQYQAKSDELGNAADNQKVALQQALDLLKNEILATVTTFNEEAATWKEKHKHIERFDIKKKNQKIDHISFEISDTLKELGGFGVDMNTIDPRLKLKKVYIPKKDKDYHKIEDAYHEIWDGHKDISELTKKLKKNEVPKLEKFQTKDLEKWAKKMADWLFDAELFIPSDELKSNKENIEAWKHDIEILVSLADIKHDEMDARKREKESLKMYKTSKKIINFALKVERDFKKIDKKKISQEEKDQEKIDLIYGGHPEFEDEYKKLKNQGFGFVYAVGDPKILERVTIMTPEVVSPLKIAISEHKQAVVNIQGALNDLDLGHQQWEELKIKLFSEHLGKDPEVKNLMEVLSEDQDSFKEIWGIIEKGGDNVGVEVVSKIQKMIQGDQDVRNKISHKKSSVSSARKYERILSAGAEKVDAMLNRLKSKHGEILDLLKDYSIENESNEFNEKLLKEFPLSEIDQFVIDKKALFTEIVKKFDLVVSESVHEQDESGKEQLNLALDEIEELLQDWDNDVYVVIGPNAKKHLKELGYCKDELLDIQKLVPVYRKFVNKGTEGLSLSMRNYFELMESIHDEIVEKGKEFAKLSETELKEASDQQRLTLDLYENYKLYASLFDKKIKEHFKGEPKALLKKMNEFDNLTNMNRDIVDIINQYCSYGTLRNERRELIDFFNDYAATVEKLHGELQTNLSASELEKIRTEVVHGLKHSTDGADFRKNKVEALQKMNELEKEAIIAAAKEEEEAVHKLLFKFQGQSVYTDESNVNQLIPKTEMAKIRKAAKTLSDRALRLLELGYTAESEKLTTNIPNTFLPSEFIQEKRIFTAVNEALVGLNQDSLTLSKMDEELKKVGKGGDAWEALGKAFEITGDTKIDDNTKLLGSLGALNEIFNAGGSSKVMEDYAKFADDFKKFETDFGKDNPGQQPTIDEYISTKGLDSEASQKANEMYKIHGKVEADKELANIMKAAAFGGKVIIDSIGLVLQGIDAIRSEDARAITAFSLNILSKVSDWGASATELANNDALKPLQAVLKSVSILTKFASGEVTLREELSSLAFWDETVSNLFDLGAGVGEVIAIFTPIGGIISSSFALFKDAKDLYKFIKTCQEKARLLKRAEILQLRAEMENSTFLSATKGIRKNAEEEYTKAKVDVAGKSIMVLGDGAMVVGSVMTITPIAPIGLAVSIGGKITKALGAGLIMGYDAYKSLKDFAEYHHVKKYIKAAQKGDLEAIDYILEHKMVYAQAFLVYGAIDRAGIKGKDEDVTLNPDPIVEYYCNSLGIDIDNMNEETADEIIKEYIWGKESEISAFTNRFDKYNSEHVNWDENLLRGLEAQDQLGKGIETEINIYFECKKFQEDHFIINKFAKLQELHNVKEGKKANLKQLNEYLETRESELNVEVHKLQKALKSLLNNPEEMKEKSKELKDKTVRRELFIQYRSKIPKKILA